MWPLINNPLRTMTTGVWRRVCGPVSVVYMQREPSAVYGGFVTRQLYLATTGMTHRVLTDS